MYEEEVEGDFEIIDYTSATSWERLVARIEELVKYWGLNLNIGDRNCPDDSQSIPCTVCEQVLFDDVPCFFKYHYSGHGPDTSNGMPGPLFELVDDCHDFPTRGHHLQRWFGVRNFVILAPMSASHVEPTEAQMLLSAIYVALSNSHSAIAAFVPVEAFKNNTYQGVLLSDGCVTDFAVQTLPSTPSTCHSIADAIALFRSKLAQRTLPIGGGEEEEITAAVNVTFMSSTADYQWKSTSCAPQLLDTWGPQDDPVECLHLQACWPRMSSIGLAPAALDPSTAPRWLLRSIHASRSWCRLSEWVKIMGTVYLESRSCKSITDLIMPAGSAVQSFATSLLLPKKSSDVALGQVFEGIPIEAGSNWSPLVKAAPVNSLMTSLSLRLGQTGHPAGMLSLWYEFVREVREYWDMQDGLNDPLPFVDDGPPDFRHCLIYQKLQMINCCIKLRSQFRTATATTSAASATAASAIVSSSIATPLQNQGRPSPNTTSAAGQPQLSNVVQSASEDDTGEEWADATADGWDWPEEEDQWDARDGNQAGASHATVPASGGEKRDVMQARIPGRAPAAPDSPTAPCSHQGPAQFKTSSTQPNQDSTHPDSKSRNLADVLEGGGANDGDEPLDEDLQDDPWDPHAPSQREGLKEPVAGLTLLRTGQELYAPVTQDVVLMTEDQLQEQEQVFATLGNTPLASHIRANMQKASVLSDIEAFKAANPGCVLEDFVRWYSPRDWTPPPRTPEDCSNSSSSQDVPVEVDAESSSAALRERERKYGVLSVRMRKRGNLWKQLWKEAKPCPVCRQKSLFNFDREALKALQYLEQPPSPSHFFQQLLYVLATTALHIFASIKAASLPYFAEPLRRLSAFLSSTCTSSNDLQEGDVEALYAHMAEVESSLAVASSLLHKLPDHPNIVEDLLRSGHASLPLNDPSRAAVRSLFQSADLHAFDEDMLPPPDAEEILLRCTTSINGLLAPNRMYILMEPDEFRIATALSSP